MYIICKNIRSLYNDKHLEPNNNINTVYSVHTDLSCSLIVPRMWPGNEATESLQSTYSLCTKMVTVPVYTAIKVGLLPLF